MARYTAQNDGLFVSFRLSLDRFFAALIHIRSNLIWRRSLVFSLCRFISLQISEAKGQQNKKNRNGKKRPPQPTVTLLSLPISTFKSISKILWYQVKININCGRDLDVVFDILNLRVHVWILIQIF